MKTLIELYDESPIENVLATEVFRPKETVLLCPPEIEPERVLKKSLEQYFRHRKVPVKITVIPVSLIDAGKVAKRLQEVIESREDCAIEISGGTDASLFAAGLACKDTPVFTYSRKRNCFFEIQNAPFARSHPCNVKLDAESCFLMAGGRLLPGREDNSALKTKLDRIGILFDLFLKHKRNWMRQIGYIQKISSSEPGILAVSGPLTEKVDRSFVTVSEEFLTDLSEAGMIRDLEWEEGEVHFSFVDETERFWLRDFGAILELQVYRAALLSGCFDDVVLSAVVNWEGGNNQRNSVTNEIDVVAVSGINPLFISCKTGEIRTEALNELAILRDRFGGKNSRAMIVTSHAGTGHSPARLRASELNIEVVELCELGLETLMHRVAGGAQRIFDTDSTEAQKTFDTDSAGAQKNFGLGPAGSVSGSGLTESNDPEAALSAKTAGLPMVSYHAKDPFMQEAIEEARVGIHRRHGGPFGAVVVKDGKVIGAGHNMVLASHDSTAHGEIMAIRNAERYIGSHDLSGCTIYTTGEPCHMCLTAVLWANIKKVYYGGRIADNAMIGFRDEAFDNLFGGRENLEDLLEEVDREACLELFKEYLGTNPGNY